MDTGNIIRQLGQYMQAFGDCPCLFLAEQTEMHRGQDSLLAGKKLPLGTITTRPGPDRTKTYVNGTGAGEIRFAIRLYVSTEEGLWALETMAELTSRLENFTLAETDGVEYGTCRRMGLPERKQDKNGGYAIYEAAFSLPWRQVESAVSMEERGGYQWQEE